jgi:hypothetical protein
MEPKLHMLARISGGSHPPAAGSLGALFSALALLAAVLEAAGLLPAAGASSKAEGSTTSTNLHKQHLKHW